jgi:hypothetical protein
MSVLRSRAPEQVRRDALTVAERKAAEGCQVSSDDRRHRTWSGASSLGSGHQSEDAIHKRRIASQRTNKSSSGCGGAIPRSRSGSSLVDVVQLIQHRA